MRHTLGGRPTDGRDGQEAEIMGIARRALVGGTSVIGVLVLMAGPALAHECINASKKHQDSGAQLVLGPNDEVLYISKGLQNRISQALVDFDTGEGFHGLIAFDVDGDGVADASTWIGVGPDGEIPLEAQFRGPACRGLTNIGVYFDQCLGA
jgi:hypothetical protein